MTAQPTLFTEPIATVPEGTGQFEMPTAQQPEPLPLREEYVAHHYSTALEYLRNGRNRSESERIAMTKKHIAWDEQDIGFASERNAPEDVRIYAEAAGGKRRALAEFTAQQSESK